MARPPSPGKCFVCGGHFDKSKMTVHLRKCLAEHDSPAGGAGKDARLFRLVVEGAWAPRYWLHLELPANSTLFALDGFLRDIWLECCGHMSAFHVDKMMYVSGDARELDAHGMSVGLGNVLSPGTKFSYEYDFGTTTPLNLKVAGERQGPATGKGSKTLRLLARNDAPEFKCEECGQPATRVCTQCMYDDKGWLCEKCVEMHECGEEMCLPVVNSPRMGQCAYTGEE